MQSPSNKAVTQQLAEIGNHGSVSGRGALSARSNPDKNDVWADNIHMSKHHEDPTIPDRLLAHNKMLSEADKFIDFI